MEAMALLLASKNESKSTFTMLLSYETSIYDMVIA